MVDHRYVWKKQTWHVEGMGWTPGSLLDVLKVCLRWFIGVGEAAMKMAGMLSLALMLRPCETLCDARLKY